MKKNKNIFLITFFILCYVNSFSQKIDTIIKNDILTSYFSYKYYNPLFVKYKLYKGGGDCNRSQFSFKTDKVKNSAKAKDYNYSGYNEGHLVSAEDFAYDCKKMEQTFKYYNCVPQTPKLNRGIWKTYETRIRKQSQTDSLIIWCSSVFVDRKLPNSNVYVPTYCWKVVKSMTTNKIVYILLFDNEMESSSVKQPTLKQLIKLIGYDPTKY